MEGMDWVMCGIRKVDYSNKVQTVDWASCVLRASTADEVKGIMKFVTSRSGFGYIYNKLYKTEIIRENNIFYPTEFNVSEDSFFTILFFLHVKSLCLIPNVSYIYGINNVNSISAAKYKPASQFLFSAIAHDKLVNCELERSVWLYAFSRCIKMYVRCFGICFLYPLRVFPLRDRTKMLFNCTKSFFCSNSMRKHLFLSIRFFFVHIRSYLRRMNEQ